LSNKQCRQWIAQGKTEQALAWLMSQEVVSAEQYVLLALCKRSNQLLNWEKAIKALLDDQNKSLEDLLLAYSSAAKWSRIGCDRQKQLKYLTLAIQVASQLKHDRAVLDLEAIKANTLLQLGRVEMAEESLTHCIQKAIQVEYHLLIIAEGILLCGIWMRKGQFQRVASLCLNIEISASKRYNWIAFATARMMRASCWMIMNSPQQAISLLFETGNFLYQQGAVAALNLVKARLGEFQIILGQDRFEELRQKE